MFDTKNTLNCRKSFGFSQRQRKKRGIQDSQFEKIIGIFQEENSERTIIIKEKSHFEIICRMLERVLYFFVKSALWIILSAALSCAITALLNSQIRELLIRQLMGGF